MNGFNSGSPIRKAEAMDKASNGLTNCLSCGALTKEYKICRDCLRKYLVPLKQFMYSHKNASSFLDLNFHKDLPIPRVALHALAQAGYLKLKIK